MKTFTKDELISRLNEIKNMGWIKNAREGNWEYIEELLKHAFIDNNIPVTVYDYGVSNG